MPTLQPTGTQAETQGNVTLHRALPSSSGGSIPAGGATGQSLVKLSAADNDVGWGDRLSGTLTATRIPFATGASELSDDLALVWDNVNKWLGVGATPSSMLHVAGNITVPDGFWIGGGTASIVGGMAFGYNSRTLNSGFVGTPTDLTSIGRGASATATAGSPGATAIGSRASATQNGTALGAGSTAGAGSVAVGHSVSVSVSASVGIGAGVSVTGGFGVAIGNTMTAGNQCVSLGYNCQSANVGVCIGSTSRANNGGIALGIGAVTRTARDFTIASGVVNGRGSIIGLTGFDSPNIRYLAQVESDFVVTGSSWTSKVNFALINYAGTHDIISLSHDGTTGGILARWDLTFSDTRNLVFNATTGTKIGTATTQKLGFWNATPVIQPAGAAQAALTNSSGGTADGTISATADATTNDNFAEVFMLLNAIRSALVTTGIMKGAA